MGEMEPCAKVSTRVKTSLCENSIKLISAIRLYLKQYDSWDFEYILDRLQIENGIV